MMAEYFPKQEWAEGSVVLFKLYNQLKGPGKYFKHLGDELLIGEKTMITFDMVVNEVSYKDLINAMLELSEDVKKLDKDGSNSDLELLKIVKMAAVLDSVHTRAIELCRNGRKDMLTEASKGRSR
jgi:hypothetical protein